MGRGQREDKVTRDIIGPDSHLVHRWTVPVLFPVLERRVSVVGGVPVTAHIRVPPRHAGRSTLNVYNTNKK